MQKEIDDEEEQIVPLTAKQVQALRAKHQPMPLWIPLLAQSAVATLAMLVGLLMRLPANVLTSMLYGALSCLIPAVLCTAGYLRMTARISKLPQKTASGAGCLTIFVWEGIKIFLSTLMLLVAPRCVDRLSWLAMLVVFIIAVKGYWLAFIFDHIRRRRNSATVV